jgi:periplasmic divalent cation tolerance protein
MLRVAVCNCSPAESKSLARTLVEERLAACVNIIGGVTSVYVWQGEHCEEVEDTLLIKTTGERYGAMKARLVELHSYDVPEVLAVDPLDVLDSYARWAHERVR